MAEYVRRRRPPDSHPYWDRLRDRAHPPRVFARVAVPTAVGLAIGLYGGLRPEFTMAQVVEFAAIGAGCVSGAAAIVSLVYVLVQLARHPQPEPRVLLLVWVWMVSVLVFAFGMLVMVPILAWYAVCSGLGPWGGMFVGGSIALVPSAFVAAGARRRWRERQRAWPRWDHMRAPRGPAVAAVTPIPMDPLPAGEATPRDDELLGTSGPDAEGAAASP